MSASTKAGKQLAVERMQSKGGGGEILEPGKLTSGKNRREAGLARIGQKHQFQEIKD